MAFLVVIVSSLLIWSYRPNQSAATIVTGKRWEGEHPLVVRAKKAAEEGVAARTEDTREGRREDHICYS